MVLCVDGKSQIQALDRTQPGLPMKKGRCGTMTHDYKRNGTTCLFAALNVLEGKVIGSCYPRHRNGEFLKFLRKIDREIPQNLDVHMILDNYGTHGHPNVKAWLDKHPRYVLHFTPTSASWLNLVERWFGRSRENEFAAVCSKACRNWWRRSRNTFDVITKTPSLSCGPSASIRYWKRSVVVKPLLKHYTSFRPQPGRRPQPRRC